MINLAVINLKTVLKNIVKLFVIIIAVIIAIRAISFFKMKKICNMLISDLIFDNTKIIDNNILICKYTNSSKKEKESGIKRLLESELSVFSTEEELMELENQEEIIEFSENEKNIKEETLEIHNENLIEDENNLKEEQKENIEKKETKVIEKNNKKDTFTNNYGSVKIKNESQYALTPEMILPDVDFLNKKDIIIYHTHTCESYTPTQANNYQASGNFRTIDLNYSVARVGSELSNYLIQKEYNVIHDKTYHDYPAYSGSYTRSLKTIKNIVEKNKEAQLVIDLHRDALGNNSAYAPTVQIGDEIVAQLMFVIGTNGGGLTHEDWLNNFKLAIKIQEKANEMYPGLFKPIILRNSRYNQHITTGAVIIEVGATGNTLEECNLSMKYLSEVLSQVLK